MNETLISTKIKCKRPKTVNSETASPNSAKFRVDRLPNQSGYKRSILPNNFVVGEIKLPCKFKAI